jgi:hypothetical protein
MLVAVLNCCTKEELEEEEEEAAAAAAAEENTPASSPVMRDERRKVIKNKILAVGRISRVFQLLRYVVTTELISFFVLTAFSVARNPKEFRNSRMFLGPVNFLMGLLSLVQKGSRTPSTASKMHVNRILRTSVFHPI